MSKITPLDDLTSLSNETSAINTINTNNQRIEDAFQNTVSRDGSTPNTMLADFDMNNNRILNVPAPVADSDVATYGVIKDSVEGAAASAAAALVSENNAAASEASAADSAAEAALQAAKLSGTSTTSVTIGTGTKAFTTQTDKDFNGNNVRVYSAADLNNYMDGLATYSGTSLSVDVTTIGGSGTFSDWVIKVNGHVGATGPAGVVTDGDYGDITVTSSGMVWTIDPGVVTPSKLADADFGDFTVASGVATIDDGTVSPSKLADADFGDFTVSSGVASLDSGTVDTAELVDNSVTLAKMEDGTQGDMLTYTTAGAPSRLGTGAAGQVLTSNGAAADLTWEDAGGGATELLASLTASSSYIDFTSVMDSTNYVGYMLAVEDMFTSTSPNGLAIQVSHDNGSTWETTSGFYSYHVETKSPTSTTFSAIANNSTTMATLTDNLASQRTSGYVLISYRVLDNGARFFGQLYGNTGYFGVASGITGSTEVNALRILSTATGTITSGTFKLYGIKRS